jgi:hypothetical protein
VEHRWEFLFLQPPKVPLALSPLKRPAAAPSNHWHTRLIRVWGFQGRLGIITKTLAAAAPQLSHLLVVLAACMALFAAALVLCAGAANAAAATQGRAFYDAFLLLLGGAEVGMAQLLPAGSVSGPAPARLLAALVFYGREALFIFVLLNFFMAVLGGVFGDTKAAASRTARSIPAELRADVLPELRAWGGSAAAGAAAAWQRRRQKRRLGSGGNGSSGAAPTEGGEVVLEATAAGGNPAAARRLHTSAALLAQMQAAYPSLVLPHSKAFSDRVACIKLKVPGAHEAKLLNLGTLQRLIADLSLAGAASAQLAALPAAPRHKAAAEAATAEVAGQRGAAAAAGNPATAAAAAAAGPAVAAGADPRAVAGALAVAEQLMLQLGQPCSVEQLQRSALQLVATSPTDGPSGAEVSGRARGAWVQPICLLSLRQPCMA